jgi:FMN reductase
MERIRILAIGGSQRENSRTKHAVELALDGASRAGAEIEFFDLRDHPLPLYDDRKEINSYPKSVFQLLEAVRRSDGLIIGTPVYHGTLSGAVKNALDFLELLGNDKPPYLTRKVVGLLSVAGGSSGTNAINSLIAASYALKAWVLPRMAIIPGDGFDETGCLKDSALVQRLNALGEDIVKAVEMISSRRS